MLWEFLFRRKQNLHAQDVVKKALSPLVRYRNLNIHKQERNLVLIVVVGNAHLIPLTDFLYLSMYQHLSKTEGRIEFAHSFINWFYVM